MRDSITDADYIIKLGLTAFYEITDTKFHVLTALGLLLVATAP